MSWKGSITFRSRDELHVCSRLCYRYNYSYYLVINCGKCAPRIYVHGMYNKPIINRTKGHKSSLLFNLAGLAVLVSAIAKDAGRAGDKLVRTVSIHHCQSFSKDRNCIGELIEKRSTSTWYKYIPLMLYVSYSYSYIAYS